MSLGVVNGQPYPTCDEICNQTYTSTYEPAYEFNIKSDLPHIMALQNAREAFTTNATCVNSITKPHLHASTLHSRLIGECLFPTKSTRREARIVTVHL